MKINFLCLFMCIWITPFTAVASSLSSLGNCDIEDQEWLNDALNDDNLCNFCIAQVNVYQIGDTTYIGFIADDANCSDALTTIYYCDGTERCKDGGFAGFTECEDWWAANPTLIETLWLQSVDCPCFCPPVFEPVCGTNGITYTNSCFAECDGITDYTTGECEGGFNCDVFSLPWLDSLLTTADLCSFCISEVNVYQQNDTTYIGLIADNVNCADALTTIYNCNYELVCQEGGIAGAQECTALFGELNAIYVQTLWSFEEDCECICPTIYEPVCGSDSLTYGNSCLAECVGIFDYTPGKCDSIVDGLIDIEYSNWQIHQIYPNPITKTLNINFSSQERNLKVEIYTSFGLKLKEKSLTTTSGGIAEEHIDLSNVPTGIYLLQFSSKNRQQTYKIVKN